MKTKGLEVSQTWDQTLAIAILSVTCKSPKVPFGHTFGNF